MWFQGLRQCCFCSNTQFCQGSLSDFTLIHPQEATGCVSCECCLSLHFLPRLPCNSWKTASLLYENCPSADVFRYASSAVLNPASTAWAFSWQQQDELQLSTPSCALCSVPQCSLLKSGPQPCHAAELLISFTKTCTGGDDGRMVSSFCEPGNNLCKTVSRWRQTYPHRCVVPASAAVVWL